jgi:two-component system response regulator YesN
MCGEARTVIRVLVADDEEKVCQLICHLIDWDNLGMELIGTASNGEEALRMIEDKKPDLMLTDIRMPGYSGLELMKRARESSPDMEFIIISGYSSFEYAQTAIQYGVQDYILKPINQQLLDATLQKVRTRYLRKHKADSQTQSVSSRLLKMIWYDLENGFVPAGIEEVNQKYGCHFCGGIFQTFCIREAFKDYQSISLAYAQSVFELLLPKAEAVMEGQLRPLCQEFEISSRDHQIVGILNYAPQNQLKVQEALLCVINELRMAVHAFEYIRLSFSVSAQAHSITKLLECREQAKRAMEQRILTQKATALLTAIPVNGDLPEEKLYKDFSVTIRRGIDLQNAQQIKSAVQSLQREVSEFSASGSQLLLVVKTAYHLFLMSGLVQNEYHFYPTKDKEISFQKKADLCGSASDLFRLLEEACLGDLESACQWIDQQKVRPINEAKRYISEHYAQPLSLDDVCSQVGFSASYFSTLFRKETGKTFLEYLLEIRMEAAKGLLRETKMTMEAVCEAVGVHDYKRFSKAFKKAMGISLKEYRNLYS